MSDERQHHSPLGKLHLPWKRHKDDTSSQASEKQPLNPPTKSQDDSNKQQHYGAVAMETTDTNARLTRIWDVKMPPAKKTMVHGHLVPTMGGTIGSKLIQKKRRFAIEIHTDDNLGDEPSASLLRGDSYEEGHEKDELHVGEKVLVRILKPALKAGASDESSEEGDQQTISTIGFHAADEEADLWVTNYVLGLDDVQILKRRGSHCEMKLGHGSETQVRHVNFVNAKEAASFCQVLENLLNCKHKLTAQRVKEFRGVSPVSEDDGLKIRVLVEIVSGIGLPVADRNATDPYVIVRLGSQEVHRTTPIYGTVNPIYTTDSGSLFLLSATPEEFFGSAQGLCFVIKDYDTLSANDTLGKVFVHQDELLNGEGERTEYDLLESSSKHKKHPGKLVLRFRKASDDDVLFMERLASAKKANISGVYADETFVQPHVSTGKFLHREHRKAGTQIQHRVKPGPDPDRPIQATKWMTEAELESESMKPSTKWIEAGSGDLGRLLVEILGCDGLPNMDTAAMGGGKTDAFACIVYEDSVVNTEVINDTLRPRWMPWTQRAFIFHVMHMSSDLMVGVLDYDSPAPMAEHDPIGRAEIDITNLHPGTEYILYYDLYTSAVVKKRKSKGTIKLRVRLELENERKAIMSAMQPPPQIYVNVATYRDYRVANFVIEGKYNIHVFNMDLFAEYVEELKGTALALLPVMKNAAYTVVFWRGHYPFGLRVLRCPPLPADNDISFRNRYTKNIKILLPIHSVIAFIGGILLVEDYNLFPSFLLFAIAWLFLSMSGHIADNPSPWRHPRSFVDLASALVSNRSSVVTIEPHQNEAEIKKYLEEKAEADRQLEEEAKKKATEEEETKDAVGHLEAMEDGAEVDMRTKTGTGLGVSSVNPLKPILFPMQINLEVACRMVHIGRSFATWEESYYCFWIVIISIAGGLLLLFIPWGWLVRWALRIAVWTLLGPWMKLVDIHYMKKTQSAEKAQEAAEARMKAKYEALLATATHTQTRKEELIKLKDMKQYMFGQYLAVVPRFKQQRHLDFALAPSYASPKVAADSYAITCRKFGQQLSGDMIPRREIEEVPPTEEAGEVKMKVRLFGTKGWF